LSITALILAIFFSVVSTVSEIIHAQANVDISDIVVPVASLSLTALLIPCTLFLPHISSDHPIVLVRVADVLKASIVNSEFVTIAVINANCEFSILKLAT